MEFGWSVLFWEQSPAHGQMSEFMNDELSNLAGMFSIERKVQHMAKCKQIRARQN